MYRETKVDTRGIRHCKGSIGLRDLNSYIHEKARIPPGIYATMAKDPSCSHIYTVDAYTNIPWEYC